MNNDACYVYADNSVFFPNASQIIETSPQALHFQIEQYSLAQIMNDIFNKIYKAISISFWVIMVLGIDPYEIWAMLYFNILFLVMLYDYEHSIPNTYSLYEGLEYMVLKYGDKKDANMFAIENS